MESRVGDENSGCSAMDKAVWIFQCLLRELVAQEDVELFVSYARASQIHHMTQANSHG